MATEIELIKSLNVEADHNGAAIVRDYLGRFHSDMTTAELIGAFRKLVDTGAPTDAEECALLDLLAPLA